MPAIPEEISFDNLYTGLVLAVILSALAFYLYRRTRPELSAGRRILLGGLRTALFISLILFLVNPVLRYEDEVARDPVIPILLDISRSMELQEKGKSRADRADSLLRRLVNAVPERFREEVVTIPFARDIAARDAPGTVRSGTDIVGAVRKTARRYRQRNLPCIILLTDGVDTGSMDGYAGSVPPVYSICIGDTTPDGKLGIEDLIYSGRVYSGMESQIEALIISEDIEGREITAGLFEDGTLLESKSFTGGGERTEHRIRFDYSAGKPGEHVLEIRLSHGGTAGSGRKSDRFTVTVIEDKSRILYLDSYPDWNTTFLRTLSEGMKRYIFDFVTLRPGRGLVKLSDYSKWEFPRSAEELNIYSCIMVADAGQVFSDEEITGTVTEYITAGGGAIFLADTDSPLLYDDIYRSLRPVLPVKAVSGRKPVRGEFQISITAERTDPVSVAMAQSGTLSSLPPLPAYLSGYRNLMSAKAPIHIEGEDGTERTPFLSIAATGEGITAFVAGMGVWRWKLAGERGETAYNTFFSSLIQYLAGGEGSGRLNISAGRSGYSYGERPRIRVNTSGNLLPDAVRGRLYRRNGDLIKTFIFEPRHPERGIFTVDIPVLEPGDYRVAGREILGSGSGLEGEVTFSVDSVSVELIRKTADPHFLRHFSGKSGGGLIQPEGIDELFSETVEIQTAYAGREELYPLRSSGVLLIIMLFSASTEWVLRKIWGLV